MPTRDTKAGLRTWGVGLALVLAVFAVGCTGESPLGAMTGAGLAGAAPDSIDFPGPNPGPPAADPDDADLFRRQLLEQVNSERTRRGLPALSASETLGQVAEYHVSRMIDGNFFAHVDPYDKSTVGSRAAKFDYLYIKVGENLAAGQTSPRDVLTDWLKSPGHQSNLLDPDFSEAGVAVMDGGKHGRYWALELGRPAGR